MKFAEGAFDWELRCKTCRVCYGDLAKRVTRVLKSGWTVREITQEHSRYTLIAVKRFRVRK